MTPRQPRCTIVPPYLLEAMVGGTNAHAAASAERTLRADTRHRARRSGRPVTATGEATPAGGARPAADQDDTTPQRLVSDAHGEQTLPGDRVRGEGDPATGDAGADEAYDGLGLTWTLFHDVFGRDSLDGKGLPLLATVHYGEDYDNAFWDGTQMVFGDGDGVIFQRFTLSLDVIGHELAHGLTETTAGLMYQGQSGALNESVSDVFGSLVRQHATGQTADTADWLIGAELFTEDVQGVALRSMKAPGTAYDDPRLGKDPQPATMADYVVTADDNGGVHINSGIPNHAFYLVATTIGGSAWEAPGQIWFDTLTGAGIAADCDFSTFAGLTVAAATARYGEGSTETSAVTQAWQQVGVLDAAPTNPAPTDPAPTEPAPTDPAPTEPAPTEPAPADPAPTEPAPTEPAPTDPAPTDPAPTADTEVRVRRTGGIAGQVRERTVRLGELPDDDVQRWWDLLSGQQLEGLSQQAAATRPVPDAFNYSVTVPTQGVAVTLPEHGLPEGVRGLMQRTLGD